jgi:type II restriction enzyme
LDYFILFFLDLCKRSNIDTEIQISGRPPTTANFEFLTNKEQGDWAEQIVYKSINNFSADYFAVQYGRSDSISAGDEGFADFYKEYQRELNTIGKRPDILIFKSSDFPYKNVDINNDNDVKKAVIALEVRSSSFLIEKYTTFMDERQNDAINRCGEIQKEILNSSLGKLLKRKNSEIYKFIEEATDETFKELNFRLPSWSSTSELRDLTKLLKELKESIKTLHKRDYLGFAERSYNLYWKRLLARLRVAQVPLNLLKLLKTLASSLLSTNVSQD